MDFTTSCPRCGHSFNCFQGAEKLSGHTIIDAPNLWIQQENDVAVIQEEVRRLDGLIHQLNQDRARLLRRANNMQATTRRLPPEVLSTIFQLARPPIEFDTRPTPSEFLGHLHLRRGAWKEDDFQLVLGAVSSHWRQVVWATPQLWTTISIEVHESTCENIVSLLDLYFKNSRGLLMTVELDFRAQLMQLDAASDVAEEEESLSLIEPLQASLLNNVTKLQNLIVTGLMPEWFSFIDKKFSQCESLMLYWPTSHTDGWAADLLDLTELSNLRRLCIKELYTPVILPWSILTTLQLYGMPINLCVESLAMCPNLITFEATFTHPSPSHDPLCQPVVLEYLESLTWCHCDDDEAWSSAFLHHIRFSKLRILKWFDHESKAEFSEDLYNAFATFCSHLPMTLQVLELTDVWYGRRIMKTLLASVPCLLELVLNECSEEDVILSMIGRGVVGLIENTSEGRATVNDSTLEGPKITPCLRKLVISGEHSDPALHMIAEMLEALCSTRVTGEDFSLELPWRTDTRISFIFPRLKRLAESGLRFKIFLGSDPLDYMVPR